MIKRMAARNVTKSASITVMIMVYQVGLMRAFFQIRITWILLHHDKKKFCAFYISIVGECSRKYEGGCLNWHSDGLLLQKNYGVFTIQDCYEKCFAYNGCHGFFLNKGNSACDLYKQGCIRRIDSPQYWDYYEMDDCKGISSVF